MSNITIGETIVRQRDGLYSLNDLHRASGGEAKHKPDNFLRIDQTRALIEEINFSDVRSLRITTGRNGGTYACRELVIAYAAWISAAFHLKVIRVFLASTAPAGGKICPPHERLERPPQEPQEPDFDVRAALLDNLPVPGRPMSHKTEAMIREKAIELTMEAHSLIAEHIRRRVHEQAYVPYAGLYDGEKIEKTILGITLGNALVHKYQRSWRVTYNALAECVNAHASINRMVREHEKIVINARKCFDEMKKAGLSMPEGGK